MLARKFGWEERTERYVDFWVRLAFPNHMTIKYTAVSQHSQPVQTRTARPDSDRDLKAESKSLEWE